MFSSSFIISGLKLFEIKSFNEINSLLKNSKEFKVSTCFLCFPIAFSVFPVLFQADKKNISLFYYFTLIRSKKLLKHVTCIFTFNRNVSIFFSIRVFFHGHWQLTGQQGNGRDHLIPLYHFHSLTNIRAFVCNFAREMTITYF